jgi:NADP-dependent 3-hydroxy acid dehydrogenase YdfG
VIDAAAPDRESTLAGMKAVVTGASRGIGEATARALAGAGATVALVARSRDALERIAASLQGRGIVVPCDLRRAAAVDSAAETIRVAFGGATSILVSNAGIFPLAPIHELTGDDFAAAVELNLVAPFRFLRALLPAMREARRGHVVTIGSVADRVAYPGNAAYAATKFGARAVHEVLREETRGSGVRATLVSPGATDTALWDPHDPDRRADLPSRDRMLRAEEVAAAVLFAVTRPGGVNVDEIRISRE